MGLVAGMATCHYRGVCNGQISAKGIGMRRSVTFREPSSLASLGRNGRMATHGVEMSYEGDAVFRGAGVVGIMPITSKGQVGRSEIWVNIDHAGEVGAAFVEAFCELACQEARLELMAKLVTEAFCKGASPEERDAFLSGVRDACDAAQPAAAGDGPRGP
jgi:hypothetical protein